jgi:hypothetical protein
VARRVVQIGPSGAIPDIPCEFDAPLAGVARTLGECLRHQICSGLERGASWPVGRVTYDFYGHLMPGAESEAAALLNTFLRDA